HHDVYLHAALHGADQTFIHDGVLEAFVLDEQRVLRPVDETADSIPAWSGAPDKMAPVPRREGLSIPVRLEAVDDFGDIVAPGGDDGVVARLVEVLLHPVQRPDHGQL